MSKTYPHPAMKLARPSLIGGGVLVVLAALIFRGLVPLEPSTLWAILVGVTGFFFLVFGFTVTAAGRILISTMEQAEDKEADR